MEPVNNTCDVSVFECRITYMRPALYLLNQMAVKRDVKTNNVTSDIETLRNYCFDGVKTPCSRTVRGYVALLLINDAIRWNGNVFMLNPEYVYSGNQYEYTVNYYNQLQKGRI